MDVASSRNTRSTTLEVEDPEEPFPLMLLNNELLAGVTQRCEEETRQQLERVDQRAAAVTLAHGYIRRHELDIALDVSESEAQPIIRVCGIDALPHEAPAAVRWLLARRRRVTHLLLGVADEFNNEWVECTREPLVPILDILLGSDRLKLTTVKINARFGRGCEDVVAGVSRLLQRHVATVVDVTLYPCADNNGVAAEHEHVELCQAVAACVGVQHFHVRVGDRCCLKTVERDCLPTFNQLRSLFFLSGSVLDFNALPRSSALEELDMLVVLVDQVTDGLTDMLLQRPDLFASLRQLRVLHFGADLPDGFLDAAPRLQTFRVDSYHFALPPLPFAGCDPMTFAGSLVGQFFAAKGERRLCFALGLSFNDEEGGGAVSFESVCVELLSILHAAAPDVAVACSDARVVVLGCGDILKAAVEANPAMAAVVGRHFINFLQSNGADAAAYADVVAAAGGATPDYAAAAAFFTGSVAATGGRVQLTTELADGCDPGDVVYQLTRGDGADKRQLDIVVHMF